MHRTGPSGPRDPDRLRHFGAERRGRRSRSTTPSRRAPPSRPGAVPENRRGRAARSRCGPTAAPAAIPGPARSYSAAAALAWPGPPVTIAMPGSPVSRPQASAMCTAAASWRVCTSVCPVSIAASNSDMMWLPDSVKIVSWPARSSVRIDDVGAAERCAGHGCVFILVVRTRRRLDRARQCSRCGHSPVIPTMIR